MTPYPYEQHEREVREARAAVQNAAREAKRRPNVDDAATRHWKDQAARFHRALGDAYPRRLIEALETLKRGEEADVDPILEFLEADPIFDRSGYTKEEALRLLPRAVLSDEDKQRLRAIILRAVETNGRREFRRYALIGRFVDSSELRSALQRLHDSPDRNVSRRARWALDRLCNQD